MAFDFDEYRDELLFVPLGGSNEIGMNLNLYHYQGKWLMIDFGIGFANDYLPGVEVIVPNIEFIVEQRENLLGIVLTHAHEDHLGAVPYLWEELRVPVYATPFTAAVLKRKLADDGLGGKVPVHEVKTGGVLEIGPFSLEMVPLTHSIPEMQAIALRTPKGVVMHTGDWKIDPDPLVGDVSDEETLKKYGQEGVLAIVCDSTNVFVEGESGSEAEVRKHLVKLIGECAGRVLVTTFASNIARLESIIRAAEEAGRAVALSGKSLWRITGAAQESGYLKDVKPFLTEKDVMALPKDKGLIICTGCQGEPRAALTKIARAEHPAIRLAPGDTVIFSARQIPGNESRINYMLNRLAELGVEVVTDSDRFIHVSGHPARGELTRMYQMVRPQIAIPVHGETRHIREHAKLARALQVPETVEPSNGAVILIAKGEAQEVGRVDSGYVAVDGNSLVDTKNVIFGQRRRLRDNGAIFVSLVLDKEGGLRAHPRVIAPGCLDPEQDADVLQLMAEDIRRAVEGLRPGESERRIDETIRATVRRILRRELGKQPVIEVQVTKV